MDFSPSIQKSILLFGDDFHGAAYIAAFHSIGPDQFRLAAWPYQVDLGLPVTEGVHMSRFVIVQKDYDA